MNFALLYQITNNLEATVEIVLYFGYVGYGSSVLPNLQEYYLKEEITLDYEEDKLLKIDTEESQSMSWFIGRFKIIYFTNQRCLQS